MRPEKQRRLSQLEPRIVQQRIRDLEAALALLRLTRDVIRRFDDGDPQLVPLATRLTDELNYLRLRANLPVMPRERPKMPDRQPDSPIPCYHVYIDECGTREPNPQPGFPFLSVAAVVIESHYYENELSPRIRELKRRYWPDRENVVLHEPNMRKHVGKFWFEGNEQRQKAFDHEYGEMVKESRFLAAGIVHDKAALRRFYEVAPADHYLPRDIYAIAYDYVVETVCHMLHHECDNALGTMFPESIGEREDAWTCSRDR